MTSKTHGGTWEVDERSLQVGEQFSMFGHTFEITAVETEYGHKQVGIVQYPCGVAITLRFDSVS